MEINNMHVFVSNYSFTGVVKTSLVKDFHLLKLKMEFFRILSNDNKLISMVSKSCKDDPRNDKVLNLVSTKVDYEKIFTFYDAEAFRNYLHFITARPFLDDQNNKQLWTIEFRFKEDVHNYKILLSTNEVLRIYNAIDSYYSLYFVLDFIVKEHNILEPEKVEEKKITEYIPVKKEEKIPEFVEIKERSTVDDIFELCASNTIKSSLIHYTTNYFKFFSSEYCNIITNDQKNQVKIVCPILMPGRFNIDENYFKSLIVTSNLHLDSVTFTIKKILSLLLQNYDKYNNPLHLMMISYLLFVYMLIFIYNVNRDIFRDHFTKFICVPEMQKHLIMSLIRSNFVDYHNKVFFEFVTVNPQTIINEQTTKDISKFSESYRHLLPISQDQFADTVFNNIDKHKNFPVDFKINNKKIIDIKPLFEEKLKKQTIQTKLFDYEKTLDVTEGLFNKYSFLDYEKTNGNKVITKSYKYLLDYIQNPSSLLLLDEKKEGIPKEVINLFDLLSKSVLNTEKLGKDNISTVNFYNILVDALPHSEAFTHLTLLYVVFQIIVPYYYDVYNVTQFQDVFL